MAHRIRASASTIACRTESTARAAGTFSSAACSSFSCGVAGIGQRLGAQDAAHVVVEPGVLQPAAPRPRVEQFPRLRGLLGRRIELAAQDVDPAALQQNAVDVQRLLHLTPMPLGIAEPLVGIVELARSTWRSGRSTASCATRRGRDSPRRSPDTPREPGLGLRPVARRPRRGAAFELRSGRGQFPAARLGAGARPSQPRLRFGQPARSRRRTCRTRWRPCTSRWSSDSLPSPGRRWPRSPSPTTEPTARAGRRHTARRRTGSARR